MRLLARLLLYLLLAVGTVRMIIYLAYAAILLPTALEAHNLEAKMVLLAWRAQHGLGLYPDWWSYPHVCNFYGPVNFLVVGLLGRLGDAGIPGLFLIGRAVSLGSTLLTSIILAVVIGRRYGRGAGVAGGVISLGTGPMYGFTIMVRADALAELLGLGGFLLTGRESRAARWAGVALLILAALTKQTAVVFLGAAALALALDGRRRRALEVLGGGLAVLGLVVFAVNALIEPYFIVSLLGDARTPWDGVAWHAIFSRIIGGSPELLVLPVVGLWLWLVRRPRDLRLAALALVLLAAALVTSGKVGADLNYYLNLRIAEALAVGALWNAVHTPVPAPAAPSPPRPRPAADDLAVTAAAALAMVSIVPCMLPAVGQFFYASRRAAYFASPEGRLVLSAYRVAFELAQDPKVRLLTDSGLIDLYQGERAAFGDPYLFHLLVETGRISPSTMERRIDARDYSLIVTTHELNAPGYVTQDFRLPMALVERARVGYVLTDVRPGLFFYGPRDGGRLRSTAPEVTRGGLE